MTKTIVCLANSKKYNERCVAGVEVKEDEDGYSIVTSNGEPRWLRPVSTAGHGEFPTRIASDIATLDVIKFKVRSFCPEGYQSENVYFREDSVESTSSISLSSENLDQLTSNTSLLFGNRGKAVSVDVVDELSHSLLFVKAESFRAYIKEENNQLRLEFVYNSIEYDLPVTDIKFEESFRRDTTLIDDIPHLYLTISLAVEHNGWHSKLVAGVIYL